MPARARQRQCHHSPLPPRHRQEGCRGGRALRQAGPATIGHAMGTKGPEVRKVILDQGSDLVPPAGFDTELRPRRWAFVDHRQPSRARLWLEPADLEPVSTTAGDGRATGRRRVIVHGDAAATDAAAHAAWQAINATPVTLGPAEIPITTSVGLAVACNGSSPTTARQSNASP
jgi:hypothetical protein